MEEFESKRWPIGLREFMDKDKDEVIDWEELHKKYEKEKKVE